MNQKVEIDQADKSNIKALCDLDVKKPDGFFEKCLAAQQDGHREILISVYEERLTGFVILNWRPQYAFYKRLEIPEIQDLIVMPEMRQQGIATALIAACEERARARGCTHIGIAVGLDPGYGAAQRLYVKQGYIPDGHGITYDREAVKAGDIRPVDDDLCLMMVKEIC